MKRVAIFVDAGYLYAQGSASLQGNKAKRENVRLDHVRFVKRLRALATNLQPSASLLRIYWYDGTSRGPTLDHRMLADLDDVKLRLGFINSLGQQKGVDSLLVTDLVELSRNGAICDALLLGGDEDLRIGVQIAQSFGVRLHLIGVEPSRRSQSLQLRQEADTKHEISSAEIREFLSIVVTPGASERVVIPPATTSLAKTQNSSEALNELEASLDQAIESVLARLDPAQTLAINTALQSSHSVPSQYDRRVLASCRTALGRDLTMEEKKLMRGRFIARVRALADL